MYQVYFHAGWESSSDCLLKSELMKQTPGKRGVWNDIKGVSRVEKADYCVGLNRLPPEAIRSKTLLFQMEPPCLEPPMLVEDAADVAIPLTESTFPHMWWVNKSYDTLQNMDPLNKTKALSWITSDKGRNVHPVLQLVRKAYPDGAFGYQSLPLSRTLIKRRAPGYRYLHRLNNGLFNFPTYGHRARIDFLERLVREEQDLLDLYGRGSFSGPHYKGEIDDKWEGLAAYRYSLAIENFRGPNYFSEKIIDPLLAWCMPIYWGCTNLPDYIPENAYIWIDIEDENAPERVREIVESNRRERNLDSIREARRRILDELQLWPRIEREIQKFDSDCS